MLPNNFRQIKEALFGQIISDNFDAYKSFSGDAIVPREPHQIVLHVVAALPGDKVFGHIPHDCDEGLLLALTGFFTDMALSWFLGKLRMNTDKLVV